MKIALVSDTHGFGIVGLADSIFTKRAECILHMGDGLEDAYELERVLGIPVIAVAGNNDYGFSEGAEKFIILAHKYIFMTHGHKYGVRSSRSSLAQKALEKEAHIVCYGHTHIFRDELIFGIRVINPGSVSLPRGGDMPGYAMLDLVTGSLERVILN